MAAIFLGVMAVFGVGRVAAGACSRCWWRCCSGSPSRRRCARSPSRRRTTAGSRCCSGSAWCRCSCSAARSSRSASCPDAIEWLAWLSPLWHGVDLSRALVLGGDASIGAGLAALHVGYLGAVARRRLRRSPRGRTSRRLVSDVGHAGRPGRPAGAVPRRPGDAPGRAQLHGLPARLAGLRLRASSSRCSTCCRSASGSPSSPATSRSPTVP